MNKVPVVHLEKRRNLGDLAEVEVEGLEGADSLDKDPLYLVSSRPGVYILPTPMRHVARFMGENAIGQHELALTVEARAILLRTAPVPLDLVQLLLLQKDLFRILLSEVHNWLAEEEAELEVILLAVRVPLAN